MKLDNEIWSKINWNSLRKNEHEGDGDPSLSFDSIVEIKGEKNAIVEFTNIYTFKSQETKQSWEMGKRSGDAKGFFDKNRIGEIMSIPTLRNEIEESILRKSSKKYMENNCKKILILQVSGAFIGAQIMSHYSKNNLPGNYLNLIEDIRNLDIPNNKFDEIVISMYPGQIKEQNISVSTFQLIDDYFISENGFIKKVLPW